MFKRIIKQAKKVSVQENCVAAEKLFGYNLPHAPETEPTRLGIGRHDAGQVE
jgi:hypothetical protein